MIVRTSWLLVILFGLSLAGATLMNLSLIGQSRQALDDGILGESSKATLARFHVALIVPDNAESFFEGLIAGVREGAAQSETAVQIFRYQANRPEQAETYFQLCLSAKLDGVILYETANDRISSRRLAAAGENVIFVPIGIQAGAGAGPGFIGSSSLLQGVESGNQIGQKLGSAARVGIILSPEGSQDPWSDPVTMGVLTALRAYPAAVILHVSRARTGILSGEEAAQALLKANPAVNALVCATAPITEGAAQVVVDQGRVGKVLLIGTDESPSITRYVEKGVIAASIVRESTVMGRRALDVFTRARAGQELPPSLEVGFSVRTRS